MFDVFVGVTGSNAICLQVAVPGVDVNEYCTTDDGQLNCDTVASVKRLSVSDLMLNKLRHLQ